MSGKTKTGSVVPGGEGTLSIIGRDLHVVGELATDGVVKVEGKITGSVRASRQVLVTRGGHVAGDIFTSEAVIGGEVTGSIHADERVEIQETSLINGDIYTRRLMVQEGGEVNGHIRMGDPQALEQGARVAQDQPVAVLER